MSELNNLFDGSFKHVEDASYWLKQGNILAYPTESVWGIGCDAMNEKAVKQILTIKNRPIDKGMIVITDSIERIQPLITPLFVNLTEQQVDTIVTSWDDSLVPFNPLHQQATTWLLPLSLDVDLSLSLELSPQVHIPKWITGQHNSIAVRVIAHPLIRKLCASMVSEQNPFGFIISTSCNPATCNPASSFAEAESYFSHHASVGYLLGDTLGYELPSQIKDGLTGNILR